MNGRKLGRSTGVRYLVLGILSVYAMAGAEAGAAELRQAALSFDSPVAVWESAPAHVVCDGCSPLKKLTVVPPDYAENIIKVRVPVFDDVSVEQKNGKDKEAQVDKKPEPVKVGQETVFFNFDSAFLKKSELEKLTNVIVPDAKYDITGYTCSIGDEDYNYRLALRRAQSVYQAFLKLGLDAARMNVTGKGKCCYADSDRENGRNRRVEVILNKERR